MRTDGPVFGEQSPSLLAAVFDDRGRADQVAARLQRELGLDEDQVRVILPGDPRAGREIEPDSRGIWRTAIKAHITFGLLGVVAGLVIFAVLWGLQIRAVVSSPWAVVGVLVFFCAIFGLFAGGLITLRPDQDHVILKVQQALDRGQPVIVAHPRNEAQRRQLSEALRQASAEVASSF